jgi:hypothetical protein
MTTCDKDRPVEDPPVMPQDTTFCGRIYAEKFDKTRWQIDSFLLTIPITDKMPLETLSAWLLQKDCITEAKVICTGCIFTPIIEGVISMKLKTKDGLINANLNIAMDFPLKFSSFNKI